MTWWSVGGGSTVSHLLGALTDSESPDFVIQAGHQIVGVEVTEIHPDQWVGHPRSGSAQRGREAFLQLVERQARLAFERHVSSSVWVSLFWANPLNGQPERIGCLAGDYLGERAGALLDGPSAAFVVTRDDYEGTLLEPVLIEAKVRRIADGAESRWKSVDAIPFGLDKHDFASTIAGKAGNVTKYQTRCDKVILLIAIAGDATSTTGEVAPAVREDEFVSPFDRTIVVDLAANTTFDLRTRHPGDA